MRQASNLFAENDDSLTPEERAVARFQKQRMKEATGAKFALPEGDGAEPLTHYGLSLDAADDMVLSLFQDFNT